MKLPLTILRKFALVPVWLLTLALEPALPASHPWKNKRLTLQWWAEGATDFSVAFGAILWGNCISLAILACHWL